MRPNPLILGGTTEATLLCKALDALGYTGTISLAGRVARPIRHPLAQRVGGFGGAEGLARYIDAQNVTHLIDATHPFASQMSRNAVQASAAANIPLIALTRAPWRPQEGDNWINVPDIASAVRALDTPRERIMLAVGRMHLQEFAPNPQHFYLLRLVDAPAAPLSFTDYVVVTDRGPFTLDGDLALMRTHAITRVVSKNSGGTGAQAKLLAARKLHLPVVMIDRPALPARQEVYDVAAVLAWMGHDSTERGV